MVFAARPRQNEPRQRLRQAREWTGRKLARAIAIAQPEADDARIRFLERQPFGQSEDAVEEVSRHRDVGIQQENPAPLAQTAALVDRLGETAVVPTAPQRNAAPAPQPPRHFMTWRMVVDDHYLGRAAPDTR